MNLHLKLRNVSNNDDDDMGRGRGVQNTLKFDYISSEQQLYAGIERFYAGGAQIYGHSWKKL